MVLNGREKLYILVVIIKGGNFVKLKKYNIEPTSENVLNSIKDNTTGRNSALSSFIEVIDHQYVSSLALNGDWGSGKTFFIKQAIMMLQYLNTDSGLDEAIRVELDRILSNTRNALQRPDISNKYVVLYYDAWLYDDHKDPIQSLLYFMSISLDKNYGIRSPDAKKLFLGAIETIAKWKNIDVTADMFMPENHVEKIESLEDVKLSLQEAFHDLLDEKYSLVIFVDELDRCSPAYAIRFLERVKHFLTVKM